MFSSDLTDEQFKSRLGHLGKKPCMVTHYLIFDCLLNWFLLTENQKNLFLGWWEWRPWWKYKAV